MIPVVVAAIKNTRNVVDVKLFINHSHGTTTVKTLLLLIPYILFITACSDSDINIPSKQSIGFTKTLVAIYSPTNNFTLSANKPFILDYEVLRGVKTSYVKIQVDNTTPITVARIKGRHHINGLSEGTHTILVSEYRNDGKPSGSQAMIKLTVK